MNVTLACDACGRALHVPDSLRGQAVKCPACHHTFMAPEPGSDSVPPSQPEQPAQPISDFPAQPTTLYPETDGVRFVPISEGISTQPSPWQGEYAKPQKVQAIAVMTLIGGIVALLYGIGFGISCIFLPFPGTYCLVLGILAIIKAANLMTDHAGSEKPPKAIAIMQIINIVSLDVVNLGLGIATLILLSDPEVKAYYRC